MLITKHYSINLNWLIEIGHRHSKRSNKKTRDTSDNENDKKETTPAVAKETTPPVEKKPEVKDPPKETTPKIQRLGDEEDGKPEIQRLDD